MFTRFASPMSPIIFSILASLGIIIAASSGLVLVLRGFPRFGKFVPAALVAFLGVLSWRQSAIYTDEKTLNRATLARNPKSCMAHHNLAKAIAEKPGHLQEAGYAQARPLPRSSLMPALKVSAPFSFRHACRCCYQNVVDVPANSAWRHTTSEASRRVLPQPSSSWKIARSSAASMGSPFWMVRCM
jgi:hypothetical protein